MRFKTSTHRLCIVGYSPLAGTYFLIDREDIFAQTRKMWRPLHKATSIAFVVFKERGLHLRRRAFRACGVCKISGGATYRHYVWVSLPDDSHLDGFKTQFFDRQDLPSELSKQERQIVVDAITYHEENSPATQADIMALLS